MSNATVVGKKVTKATFKSFIKKNRASLLIMVSSRFDGMTDCCESTGDKDFTAALDSDRFEEHTIGIQGVWLVGGGRDWFFTFETETHIGIEYSNCCGSGAIAIAKQSQ
jgi:hypothetical protein